MLFDVDPKAVVPVAATFMLAPLVVLVLFPLPIIRMNTHTEFRFVFGVLPCMPALAFTVANDFGGCSRGSESERAGATSASFVKSFMVVVPLFCLRFAATELLSHPMSFIRSNKAKSLQIGIASDAGLEPRTFSVSN